MRPATTSIVPPSRLAPACKLLLSTALALAGCHGAAKPCLDVPAAQLGSVEDARDAAAEISALLNRQQSDWNRGDLRAFATGYKNSPDILFIGSRISHGYAQMLEGYRRAYPTPERMGRLSFSQLEVQPVREGVATATGHFHLDRSAAAGGNADGYFLLVLEKDTGGWKIVRDDTTASPPPRS